MENEPDFFHISVDQGQGTSLILSITRTFQVPGRPTVVSIVPLTTNGSCISVREYKAVYEVGLRAVAEFLKVMGSTKQKSKDRLDMEVNSMLSAQENSEFQRLVDTVIRGFIPPKLRGFFTNPQAKEEYAKVTRDGITG